MIRDYSIYEMSPREKIVFFSLGFLGFALILFLFYHSIIVSLLGGFLIIKTRPLYERYRVEDRNKKLDIQFKDLLCSISASISSGRQMSEALVESWDNLSMMYSSKDLIMTELSHMKFSIEENNESDRILLADFARRAHNDNINNFVRVYSTCRSLGGDLEKIIARTSDILTDKMNIDSDIEVIMAQKKIEGRLIALMPIAMIFILNVLSPVYIAPLYESLGGRTVMTFALGTWICGLWLMEKIAKIEI